MGARRSSAASGSRSRRDPCCEHAEGDAVKGDARSRGIHEDCAVHPGTPAVRSIIVSIGAGIALFVIGAILVFAVNVDTSQFIDLDLVGYILMGAGVVVFLIGLVFVFRRRSTEQVTRTVDPVAGERVTRTEASSSGDGVV
ncbi:hypothetical protein GCM10009724_10780 [Microbacterium lacticum]|nr:hypothetical protein MLA01_07070 [Microbacterium lacticum]GGN18755.1 hypothetical protein GCM10009724_10780 [Microbacterium lacticum]